MNVCVPLLETIHVDEKFVVAIFPFLHPPPPQKKIEREKCVPFKFKEEEKSLTEE